MKELSVTRRRFLGGSVSVVGSLGLGLFGGLVIAPSARGASWGADAFGPLQSPDANGIQLPPGFTSRVLAVSNQVVDGTSHTWHVAPDGGATFPAADGGWVYVSNSERTGVGCVGALRFDAGGAVVDAYSILTGTSRNCAGGPTPWGTWISCEEIDTGLAYECDPFAPGSQGAPRPALGVFKHEAAAADPVNRHVYLTEDQTDGLLYRFVSSAWPSLDAGVLEAAEVLGAGEIAPGEVRSLAWHTVSDPSAAGTATRYQVAAATPFDGGEGCWYDAGIIYFSTKGNDRVWKYDTATNEISILYERATSSNPVLNGVDNVFASSLGDVYVAEDGGNLEIVALTAGGRVKPIMRLTGVSGTEITGPALSPDGRRLYFSSQRNPGITYEVVGPFAPVLAEAPAPAPLPHALLTAGLARAARRQTSQA